MPISVDTLRGLASSQTVVFDGASQTLNKASAKHSFASFFGTRAAKAVNRETMAAIKNAVLSDPRYFGVRERAAQMLSALDNGGKVDSSKIKSVVKHLDSISTPEMQKKQLSERFTLHLAGRELPEGWSSHTGEIISYLNRNMDTFIREAGGNAGEVNPSLVLSNLCETLAAVGEACGGDARAIDLAATLLSNRPQLIDTPEKARDVMGRWVRGAGNPEAGERTIETMFTGSAGAEGDAVVSSRRNQMKILQFGQREMPETLTDPNTYLRNRINEQGKVRMNEDFSLSMHRFASGGLTMFEKDINRSMKVVLPNGVRLPTDFALAREEVAKYIAGNPDATFAGLDAAAKNKAWLLMSLLSQETEKIAIETAPAACNSDGLRPLYMVRSGEGERSFAVSETETGDWIVRNDASYRIDGIIYDEQNMMKTGPDTSLDALTEIHVPRAEIDRIAGLDASTFTGIGAVALDAAVSVSTVHRLTPPLGDEGKAQYDISQIPGKLGLTDSETRLFETVARYETALLGSASDALLVMKNGQSPARRLVSYPALLADQSRYAHCKGLMAAFNRIFDGLSKGENPALPENYRKTVERFVFEELNALAASGKRLPSVKDFEKGLASGNPYLDFAYWGFDSAIVRSLLAMPMESRRPIIAALKSFHKSTDIMLFNRLVEHRDGIQSLYARGKLTAESAYTEIMGKDAPVPFTAKTSAFDVRNCFGNAVMEGVGRYVAENSGSNPRVAEMISPVYVLLSKYSISVEEAFSIALGERQIGADCRILNPFVPMAYQKIGGDTSTALAELARDLHRMTYGYAADGRVARIAPGSVFNFHLPDGMDASVSSQPVGMDAKQLNDYNSGNPSSITRLLGIYMWRLCGAGHERQVESLILGLGQGCLAPLRDMAAIHGVLANEHSQVRIDLRKLENGDVELRVSNPENCPLEFDWTVTVAPDGRQTMGEVNMRRAAGFVAVGEEAQ